MRAPVFCSKHRPHIQYMACSKHCPHIQIQYMAGVCPRHCLRWAGHLPGEEGTTWAPLGRKAPLGARKHQLLPSTITLTAQLARPFDVRCTICIYSIQVQFMICTFSSQATQSWGVLFPKANVTYCVQMCLICFQRAGNIG